MKSILAVFGTRPEAIKMAPVVKEIGQSASMICKTCVSGQHRGMLDQVMETFQLSADYDLDVMEPGQTLPILTSKLFLGLSKVLETEKPDLVLVHGDTTTSAVAAMGAYYAGIDVGHVEAGLRTGDLYAPWPEEGNRKITGSIAKFHFAPTKASAENLGRENISSDRICITGNTVIDALEWMNAQISQNRPMQNKFREEMPFFHPSKSKIILVTGHRRESFGKGISDMCKALSAIASRFEEVRIVYPVHLNPNVRKPVHDALSGHKNIHLIEPLDYERFVFAMESSYLIITDSGGIQEEAPSLGKPVLVTRDKTERPEAVAAGAVKLVGTDPDKIVDAVSELLTNSELYEQIAKVANPYGDGQASRRIREFLETVI